MSEEKYTAGQIIAQNPFKVEERRETWKDLQSVTNLGMLALFTCEKTCLLEILFFNLHIITSRQRTKGSDGAFRNETNEGHRALSETTDTILRR